MKKPSLEAVPVNNALLNVITPMELVFKRNSVTIGEYIGRVYGVIRFPPVLELGWLSKACNIPGTISAITFMPADSGELIEGISRNVQLNRGMAESAKDPLTRQRAERGAEDGERLMMRIDQHGETVGYMSILVMPLATDEEQFERICRRIDSTFSTISCKVRSLANLQREALKAISPYYTQVLLSSRNIPVTANKNVPLRMVMENLLAVSDTPAIAGEIKDLATMGKAVKEGGGEDSVAEDFSPALEALVGGNDNRSVLVEFGDMAGLWSLLAAGRLGYLSRKGYDEDMLHKH